MKLELEAKMFKVFSSDIAQTLKCLDLGRLNLSHQTEHTKIIR